MLGTVSSLAFYKVPDPVSANITGLNWRLMLGSAALPAFFVMAQVYFCPESPRWLISKGRYPEAFKSLCRLRHTKLQAARDLFFISACLEEEAAIQTNRPAIVEMFAVARNRRAVVASGSKSGLGLVSDRGKPDHSAASSRHVHAAVLWYQRDCILQFDCLPSSWI